MSTQLLETDSIALKSTWKQNWRHWAWKRLIRSACPPPSSLVPQNLRALSPHASPASAMPNLTQATPIHQGHSARKQKVSGDTDGKPGSEICQ